MVKKEGPFEVEMENGEPRKIESLEQVKWRFIPSALIEVTFDDGEKGIIVSSWKDNALIEWLEADLTPEEMEKAKKLKELMKEFWGN